MKGNLESAARAGGRRRQRGAVAVYVGVMLVALIASALIVIDTGRLYAGQRKLQNLASLAAVSAAQTSSGCRDDGITPSLAIVRSAVLRSLTSNGGDESMMTGINGAAEVVLGRIETVAGLRTFLPLPEGDEGINAVQVNISQAAPTSFLRLFTGDENDGRLVASASARQSAIGAFRVGSGLATLDAGLLNALLSALLGGDVSLDLLTYEGLANVEVTLDALAIALGVEVQDLSNLVELGLDTVLLPVLLEGLVDGLDDVLSDTARVALQNLAGAAQDKPVPLNALLGPLMDVVGNVPFINLLDLIVALGESAAAPAPDDPYPTPLKLPLEAGLVVIPGVATVSLYLQILEGPQLGIGRAGEATAKTAQVQVAVRVFADEVLNGLIAVVNALLQGILDTLTFLLELLTLGAVDIDVTGPILIPNLNLGIDVNVAQAAARLDALSCPTPSDPVPAAELSASPSIASVHVGSFVGTPSSAGLPALDTSTTSFDVLYLGLDVNGLLGFLGSLVLDLGLDLTCVSVGGACYGPSEPSPGPFEPLPLPVEEFAWIPPQGRDGGYFLAEGIPYDPPVTGNPQTVGSSLDVTVALNVKEPIVSGTGLLGGLAYVLNGLVEALVAVLDPLLELVSGLLNTLVLPLLNLLGIQLGLATVIMESITVDQPLLVSTCVPNAVPLPEGRGCPAAP